MERILTHQEIQQRVKELAEAISVDHVQSNNVLPPVMICILNGAFYFFSDLTRMMSIDCEIDFIRLKSYEGQDNSGGIQHLKELELDLKGKRVYIIDDICDSGATIMEALFMVNSRMATEVKVVTLLQSVAALKNGQIDGLVVDLPTAFYLSAVEVPNGIIVGQLENSAANDAGAGLLLAKDSPITSCVTKAVDAIRDNGTLAAITDQWLAASAGAPVLK